MTIHADGGGPRVAHGTIRSMTPPLPVSRGPLTSALFAHLADHEPLAPPTLARIDPLSDDDLHLALWCCYELHHHGFADVDDRVEWDPEVLAFRAVLEDAFEAALRAEQAALHLPDDPRLALRVIGEWAGPSLARWMEERGEIAHLREFVIHRSAYQLKEADGHTWGIPRLAGPGRAALIEIQTDEYGEGRPGAAHAELFAAGMAELGLHPGFGTYLAQLPGTTLATDNLLSLFGLHRRLRGALVGHLALFETTSVVPMSRYLAVARRIGGLPSLERFYAVHVEADAHHGRLALDDLVGAFTRDEPELAAPMVFGAAALSRVENRFARRLISCWDEGRSSLRPGIDDLGSPAMAPALAPRPEGSDGPTSAADHVQHDHGQDDRDQDDEQGVQHGILHGWGLPPGTPSTA